MALSDIVSVSISIQDNFPTQKGFGTPLILSYLTSFADTREYDNNASGLSAIATDLAADGGVNHPAYLAAASFAAQQPKQKKIKIGRRLANTSQELLLTPISVVGGQVYAFSVWVAGVETEVSHTVTAGDSVNDIATALHALLDAITGVSSADNTGSVTLVPTDLTEPIFLKDTPRTDIMTINDESADAGVATDLAAIAAVDNDWYGLVLTTHGAAEIAAAAAYALSNGKVFLANSTDSDIVLTGSSDIASTLEAASNTRTGVIYNRDMRAYAACAAMGRWFSQTPGATTLHMKTLQGVTVDALTASELSEARSKNAITYVDTSGIKHTFDGKMASGRFADITRGIDWTEARMQEAVAAAVANAEKIPYTAAGIAVIESAMRGVLSEGEGNALFASGWAVIVPALEDVPLADKASRTLNNMDFSATLQGAIHSVNIQGSVSL